MKLKFRLDGMTIKRTDGNTVVSDSQEYLEAEFTLASEDWQPPITALFGDYAVLLDVKNSCLIPWEAVKNAGSLTVSAFCGKIDNDNYLHTANCCTVEIGQSCYKQGETPKPPTPDVYQSILNKAQNAENVAQSVRDDADAGKFDGADGKDGKDGLNGADGANGTTYTPHIEPVKGGNALSWTNDGGKPNPETVTIKDGESVYCDNQPKHTATGELIAVDDVYAAQPLALGVEGKTVKDETGLTCVESAEIEIAGKNLLSLPEEGVGRVNHTWGADGVGLQLLAGSYVFSIDRDVAGLYVDHAVSSEPIASSFNSKEVAFSLEQPTPAKFKAYDKVTYEKPFNAQLEVGSTATSYEPYKQPTTLPIDLQSHKLCSLPNGVHDELRVTREGDRGHVELVKRTAEYTFSKKEKWSFYERLSTGAYVYTAQYPSGTFQWSYSGWIDGYNYNSNYYGMNAGDGYVAGVEITLATNSPTLEQFLTTIPAKGIKTIALAASEQTIDLGHIDLPELPAPNATVWTSSNLPAVTSSVEYVQDINVVLSKLMQAIVAVPAMI